MTRTFQYPLAVVGGALLAVTTMGGAFAQQGGGERYARTLAEADITARYDRQIEQQVQSQQAEFATLEQEIASLDATADAIPSLLERMFADLEQFVRDDVPFSSEERSQRIDRLRDVMANPDTEPAEKFRRLMEAYQIEMEYGRTMAAYKEKLADGRDAEFVRLGRVALLYRTDDGTESGYWDNQQKAWVPDPGSARAIEDALAIAREQKASDLIVVPVPAPQGGRS
jgi:predicted RNase H-like nuclease (RuvC/YqgF family)